MDKLNKIRLGNIITEYRERQGETQKDLAEKIGYNRYQQVSYIENGTPNRNLTFDQLITIAKHYNVSTDYLLGLTKAPTPLKTDEGKTIRAASDFTGFHSSYIKLVNKLKNADQSIIIELTERLTEELIFNYKLVNDLSDCKRTLPQLLLSRIDERIDNIKNYETLKELLVDAESEINEYIAHTTIIKNCISKTIDEYFNIGDAETYYNKFLEKKQQLLEKYNGGENDETQEKKS